MKRSHVFLLFLFVVIMLVTGVAIVKYPTPQYDEGTSDPGYLSNTVRDRIAIAGLVGTFATATGLVIGFVALKLTYEQMKVATETARQATDAATAATNAAVAATKENIDSYNRYVISTIRGHLDTAKAFIIGNEWMLAGLRLTDVSGLLMQIEDHPTWATFADRLREMSRQLTRVHDEKIQWAGLEPKWHNLQSELSSEIEKLFRPFPAAGPIGD